MKTALNPQPTQIQKKRWQNFLLIAISGLGAAAIAGLY